MIVAELARAVLNARCLTLCGRLVCDRDVSAGVATDGRYSLAISYSIIAIFPISIFRDFIFYVSYFRICFFIFVCVPDPSRRPGPVPGIFAKPPRI